MSKPKLNKDEKEILRDFEAGEFESVLTSRRKKYIQALAEETFKKDKRINIRISSRDLTSLQRRALEEGIPYQTLVSSILHKYVSGGLQDIVANKVFQRAEKTRR
jgi:predicted DNA binding CopG/RHH family protein